MTNQYLLSALPEHIAYKAAKYALDSPNRGIGNRGTVINHAFSWASTDEGQDYWWRVHRSIERAHAGYSRSEFSLTDPLPVRVTTVVNSDYWGRPEYRFLSIGEYYNRLFREHASLIRS